MRWIAPRSWWIAVLAIGVGCPAAAPSLPEVTGTRGGDASSTGDATDDSTTAEAEGTRGTDTSTGPVGSSGSSGSDSGGATDTGASVMCMPDPMDSDCSLCVKDNCCAQWLACLEDGNNGSGCFCYQACVSAGGAPAGECEAQCDVMAFGSKGPTTDVAMCTVANCSTPCGGGG